MQTSSPSSQSYVDVVAGACHLLGRPAVTPASEDSPLSVQIGGLDIELSHSPADGTLTACCEVGMRLHDWDTDAMRALLQLNEALFESRCSLGIRADGAILFMRAAALEDHASSAAFAHFLERFALQVHLVAQELLPQVHGHPG